MKVLKFGGTSVGTTDRLRRLAEIVSRTAGRYRVVVVASALAGVTDLLVETLCRLGEAAAPAGASTALLRRLQDRHERLAHDVLAPASLASYVPVLQEQLARLQEVLELAGREGTTSALRDEVLATGERVAVPLVALLLQDAGYEATPVDATRLIRTDGMHGEAVVDLAATFRQVRSWHAGLGAAVIPVVTGFIGATPAGDTTTLGRGGSDYSAALIASALQADVLERWTDVDGIYTHDPRKNKDAQRLACIVLEEAWAWNHAGRLGMHRMALDPLVAAGIPVHVRSTASPDLPGTYIFPAQRRRASATG